MKNVEGNQPLGEDNENTVAIENKNAMNDIEEDEGIDEFDDEEKALVENEPTNDDDTTIETTTITNTTTNTENTTTTLVHDSSDG
jgi:hypothetical protein